MATEYKTLVFRDDKSGRAEMAATIDHLSADGWKIKSKEVAPQNYGFFKTCCLGCIFLPLALLGKKKNVITVIMERERAAASGTPTDNTNQLPKKTSEILATSTSIVDRSKEKWYKTWWGITVIILAVIFVGIPMIGAFIDGFSKGLVTSTIDNNSNRSSARKLTKDEVLAARKLFNVEVVEHDSSQCYGTMPDCHDYVKLRITNNSDIVLPSLTVLTSRIDKKEGRIGSSRAPSIPASNIQPGESLLYDYYPNGQLYLYPGYDIQVEIEHIIAPDEEKFFDELKG